MDPEYHVSFVILDESNAQLPEEITKVTGILPTAMWRKGDVKTNSILIHKDNGWELKSALPLDAPLIQHISSLLEILNPAQQNLVDLLDQHYALIACAIYVDDVTPEIHLDKGMIKQLSALSISLDIDLYILG